MFEYELLNNHYVVHIDGKKFLIDTGNPFSFPVNPSSNRVNINGVDYLLSGFNRLNTEEKKRKTFELVGSELDGFIGTDIIDKTGLTIFKNGQLEFGIVNVDGGAETRLFAQPTPYGPMYFVQACSNRVSGMYLIDLGATFGYGIQRAFAGEQPYSQNEYDYNPEMGEMHSPMYNQLVEIAGRARNIEMGFNPGTIYRPLCDHVPFVGSITNFFDEVCVFDTRHNRLILK